MHEYIEKVLTSSNVFDHYFAQYHDRLKARFVKYDDSDSEINHHFSYDM